MATKIPNALGSMIRSRKTGMTLVRMRAGWVNFNQSVSHPDEGILPYPNEWDVTFDATPEEVNPVLVEANRRFDYAEFAYQLRYGTNPWGFEREDIDKALPLIDKWAVRQVEGLRNANG